MILAQGYARRKLIYPIGHRQFATGPNPKAKARIWAEIEFGNWLKNGIRECTVKIASSLFGTLPILRRRAGSPALCLSP